jgi:hypothetical protein
MRKALSAVVLALLMSVTGCGADNRAGGWKITVYYTGVESFHHGPATPVRGCRVLDCANGDDDLGSYPADFVEVVSTEGAGRTNSGRYLNWSHDTGFWLDSAPRDTRGEPLRPFESSAADPDVLAPGTAFTITGCGHEEGGGDVDPAVCARLRDARWTITDEFTPGFGGAHHIDAYIGEETQPGFTGTSLYATLDGATIEVTGAGTR